MNLLAYLPPIASIVLVLTSGAAGEYLTHLVDSLPALTEANVPDDDDSSVIDDLRRLINDVASDWAERVSFFNSMAISFVSGIAIYLTTSSYLWLAATWFILIVVFLPIAYYIVSHGAGQLVNTRRHLGVLGATVCRTVLLLVNIGLIIETVISQVGLPQR